MNRIITMVVCVCISIATHAQHQKVISTSDIDNFWTAYDSIKTGTDLSQKLSLINTLYIKKGTKGLKAFMETRRFNDTLWVELMDKYPKFWNSVRPNTLAIKGKTAEIEKAIDRLEKLYPELKEAEMYFTIGGLRSAGTVKDNMVLVGCEMATGDPMTDVTEFEDDWLKTVFGKQSLDNIVTLNIHEYIHTQQTSYKSRVLNLCIREGACDFIAELVMEKPLHTQYIAYGKENAVAVKELFRQEMFSDNLSNWVFNGISKGERADLGYYIGYEICKAYYRHATDKKQAIKDIIELNYDNDKAVEDFLSKSEFFKEKIDKKKLIREYENKIPHIVKIEPFNNGAQEVNPNLKEMRIIFSKQMEEGSSSISLSDKGRAYFPLRSIKGFENNGTALVLEVDLKANKEYEFVITNRGFQSQEGYKLKHENYIVKFKTK